MEIIGRSFDLVGANNIQSSINVDNVAYKAFFIYRLALKIIFSSEYSPKLFENKVNSSSFYLFI